MRLFVLCFIVSLLFCSSGAFAANPDGLYLMTRSWPGSSLEILGWLFKNGQVCSKPMGDLAHFDFQKAAARDPNSTGTYSISGKNMIIKWANGKSETGELEPDKSCFFWQMGLFCPADPFQKNAKINGVFSGGASAGYGKAANATSITFSSNGTYKLEQVGAVHSDTSAGTQLYAGSSGSETGTYDLSGTTLILKSSGGKSRQIVSFPYDDGTKGPAPRRIFFDGAMLKRID
jgi:hypothetical protein